MKQEPSHPSPTVVTRLDVARAAGVSLATAALALNDHPRVSTRTRQCVVEAATRLGFVANHAARRLARGRSHRRVTSFDQVGLIYFFGADQYIDRICMAMLQGAEYELAKLRASLFFIRVCERSDWEKVERMMRAGSVDGWLLAGMVNDETLKRLKSDRLPHVILGDHRCTQPVHNVNVDHRAVGRLAVEYFASLGHRRIAVPMGSTQFVYQQQILEGFHSARKELGLEDDGRLTANASIWQDPRNGGMKITDSAIQWLKKNDLMPTALFTPELGAAEGVQQILKPFGVEVPGEINLLACELGFPGQANPNFTRIELPMTEVGRQGAMLLHRIASEPGMSSSSEFRIAPSLIEGWSVQPRQKAE